MQANGSRPRGLTVLVPFCVGIWGSVGQSHPPRPLPDVGTHIWGGSRPQIQGKGHQGGGGFYPKRSWGGNTASSSVGAVGQEERPAARPSVPAGTQRGGKISGRVSFFFFFFGIFLLFMSLPFAGHWEVRSPDSGSSGCGYQYVFLATPQRVS